MKLGIDLSQPSTLRGIVWLLFGGVSTFGAVTGQDVSHVLAGISTIAGAFGVIIKDK
jgi:hypothetical protein